MAACYREQVANLAKALNEEENCAEAVELIRSLVVRIELTPNEQGTLDQDDPSVQQVKVVAGVGFELCDMFRADRLESLLRL